MKPAPFGAPPAASANPLPAAAHPRLDAMRPRPNDPLGTGSGAALGSFLLKTWAILGIELRKLRHDPFDLVTRAVQPILWLTVFGQVFGRLRAQAVGATQTDYLDYLTPGILAQSVIYIAIFQGIAVIWERDQGTLQKFLVSPLPRAALVLGKGLAAGVRGLTQAVTISILALLLGVHLRLEPLALLGVAALVFLGANFFATLSLVIAALVRSRERVQGMGQLITMPLFFASNALYPIALMPGWVAVVARLNPLSYMVDGLRTLMVVGNPETLGLPLDFAVLLVANLAIVGLAARLYPRLVR
ncbi:MAG: ABC transporter permease [Chloroflexota bacterium]|nr:ABC transporter permease [Chloroflexota bacterium]